MWISGNQVVEIGIRIINRYGGAILRLRSGQVATLQIHFFALFVVHLVRDVQNRYLTGVNPRLKKAVLPLIAEAEVDDGRVHAVAVGIGEST